MTQSPGSIHHRARRRTWNRRRIIVIVLVAFIYGIWFNFIDTIVYCYNNNNICKSLGEILGGNLYYQPWNVFGHMIPGLFLLLFFWNKKEELAIIELFLAGILISSAVMDSPIWGVIRLYGHDNMSLWHLVNSPPPAHNESTRDIWVWIGYYYNPIGLYGVWDGPFPTAALLFWSVVGRFAAAAILILWQYRQEKNDKPISSIKDLVTSRRLESIYKSMIFLIIAGREAVFFDRQKNSTDILDKKLFRRRKIFQYIKRQYTLNMILIKSKYWTLGY